MAEISHTWEDAARCAGVPCKNLGDGSTRLSTFPGFDQYQAGRISLEEYLNELAEYVGCDPKDALAVHNGILVEEYPGIAELVREIHELKLGTGCLSNTNEPHWEVLALNGQYPSIHSLDMKMASHLVGINKPSPEIFQTYCSTFGLPPESIVFFDDYLVNVEGALACGWNARWIDSTLDTPTQMREHLRVLGVI
jgi:putative hydrolase of the HAD superfamily